MIGSKENTTVSIKEGKYADFVILDKNILEYGEDQYYKIGDTKVLSTYFEGEKVYSAFSDNIDKYWKEHDIDGALAERGNSEEQLANTRAQMLVGSLIRSGLCPRKRRGRSCKGYSGGMEAEQDHTADVVQFC